MVPKLDKSALASALLRKNKGKQVLLAEIVSRGSNLSVNAPPIVTPSFTSKAPSKKRRSSHSPTRGVACERKANLGNKANMRDLLDLDFYPILNPRAQP